MTSVTHSPISWYRIWAMLRDPNGPRSMKIVTALAAFYLIWPGDLIPDIAPLIGWLDDLGVTTLALWWLHHVASTYQQS